MVSVSESAVAAPEEPAKPKQGHYRDGKRFKGISGDELAMQIVSSADRVFTLDEIAASFVEKGFAGNSASPVLSGLVREGKIRALGAGKYCRTGIVLKMGAGQ